MYSKISLYTNGLILKATYLPLNSFVNSFDNSFEFEPVINIELYNANRELNGLVWEDAETNELKYKQKVGNGTYDSGENGILLY